MDFFLDWFIIFDLPDVPGALCNWRNLCLVFKFSGYYDGHFLVINHKNELSSLICIRFDWDWNI